MLRSRDMRAPFEPGPTLIPADAGRLLRHAAVDLRGDLLRVYYSRIGDRPERILVSETRLTPDWRAWRASPPVDVLTPERDYEGHALPLEVSAPDEAPGRVRQLRDPGIFSENGTNVLAVFGCWRKRAGDRRTRSAVNLAANQRADRVAQPGAIVPPVWELPQATIAAQQPPWAAETLGGLLEEQF